MIFTSTSGNGFPTQVPAPRFVLVLVSLRTRFPEMLDIGKDSVAPYGVCISPLGMIGKKDRIKSGGTGAPAMKTRLILGSCMDSWTQ